MAEDESLEKQAEDVLEESVDRLAEAKNADSALETGRIEDDAVQTLVDGVARALVDGLNKPVGFYAGIAAEKCEYYSKTDIKQEIKDRTEELAAIDHGKQPIDEFLSERLEKVVVHRNTDAKQGAKYTFDFGKFKVQTEGGEESREHYDWYGFRDYIYESGGPNLAKPDKERRSGDAWRDFIVQLIDERGETRHITGKRTSAVEQLQSKIRQQTGYGTPTGALEYSGIWILTNSYDVPDWWRVFGEPRSDGRDLTQENVREIRLHETLIENAVDDVGITRDALYQELDARGYTIPGSSGPSMKEYVDGDEQRFWTLLPDIGTPRVYVPDPNADGGLSGSLIDSLEDTSSEETADLETDRQTDGDGFEGTGEVA